MTLSDDASLQNLYNNVTLNSDEVVERFDVLSDALYEAGEEQVYAAMTIQRLCEKETDSMAAHIDELDDFLVTNPDSELADNVLRGIYEIAKYDSDIVAEHQDGVKEVLTTSTSPDLLQPALHIWLYLAQTGHELPGAEEVVEKLDGEVDESYLKRDIEAVQEVSNAAR